MSVLLDTDLLSLLERRRVPVKLSAWLVENDDAIFVSVVSFAELQHGLNQAPEGHPAKPGCLVGCDAAEVRARN